MPDKVVVITGAAGGIGSALARRFVRDGASVALLDRDGEAAGQLARELEASGARALALRSDVTLPDDCTAAMRAVIDEFGGIDILVNNAGITHLGTFRETDVEVLQKVMDINFFGAVHCTKAALETLLERRGQIITISSVAGVAPLATRTGYAASKHALHGFFDSLRAEHGGDGLRVLLVCPSFVDTPIGDHALGPHGGKAAAGARTGVRKASSPDSLAEAIVRAAAGNRRLLLFPREALLSYWIARAMPRLYERLMLRRTSKPQGT
jgi:NAD(P)-dependent dehydrogenase (short-subunit alcohol dehydrogenase family)